MKTVKFNTKMLEEKLAENGISNRKLSSVVLDRSESYIRNCLDRELMGEKELRRLCLFLGVEYEDMLYVEPEAVEEIPVEEVKDNTAPSPANTNDYNDKIDLLTVGINTLYEGQIETNELLKELIKEIKITNQKLERVEKRVGSIENAIGQGVTKSIMILDKQNEIETHLRDAKSTLAIIKGRTTDIRDEICQKPAKRKTA